MSLLLCCLHINKQAARKIGMPQFYKDNLQNLQKCGNMYQMSDMTVKITDFQWIAIFNKLLKVNNDDYEKYQVILDNYENSIITIETTKQQIIELIESLKQNFDNFDEKLINADILLIIKCKQVAVNESIFLNLVEKLSLHMLKYFIKEMKLHQLDNLDLYCTLLVISNMVYKQLFEHFTIWHKYSTQMITLIMVANLILTEEKRQQFRVPIRPKQQKFMAEVRNNMKMHLFIDIKMYNILQIAKIENSVHINNAYLSLLIKAPVKEVINVDIIAKVTKSMINLNSNNEIDIDSKKRQQYIALNECINNNNNEFEMLINLNSSNERIVIEKGTNNDVNYITKIEQELKQDETMYQSYLQLLKKAGKRANVITIQSSESNGIKINELLSI